MVRAPANTMREAERRALDGENESQDSLLVFDIHKRQYGVGTTSSSPVRSELPRITDKPKKTAPTSNLIPPLTIETHPTRDVTDIDDTRSQVLDFKPTRVEDCVADPQSQAVNGPGVTVTDALQAKMMNSSQSSTQSNHGRSYDQYNTGASSPAPPLQDEEAPSPVWHDQSTPLPETQGNAVIEPATLDHVDKVTGTDKTATSVQGESTLVDFGCLASPRRREPQTRAPPVPQFPETPAGPSNPFHQSRSQLLPPSQLFGATQFSSAVKLASPTSSRPSPTDFQHNSISPNLIVSSPLRSRGLRSTPLANPTSSPQILPVTTSPREQDGPSSPVRADPAKDPVTPESSHIGSPRKRSVPELMAVYEPMHKSQERRSTSEVWSVSASFEEDDANDSLVRRRKAKSKKEAALKQLTAISFTRPPKPDDVEVPSTNRGRPRKAKPAKSNRGQTSHVTDGPSDAPDTVANSQELPAKQVPQALPIEDESTQSDLEENLVEASDEPASINPQELPEPPENVVTRPEKLTVIPKPDQREAIPETSPTEKEFGAQNANRMSPPPLPLPKARSTPTFKSSPPAFSTRLRKTKSKSPSDAAESSTSGLTNLGSTPNIPSETTPVTEDSGLAVRHPTGKTVPNSSPAVAKSNRRRALDTLSTLKSASTENLRQSIRSSRRYSSSADELSRSRSATPTFEHSLRISRAPAALNSARSMTKPQHQNAHVSAGLFQGMAFAISFQARKPGESNDAFNTRIDFSETVEKRIQQAGGSILKKGFDELFDVSVPTKTGPVSPVSGSRIDLESDISLNAVGKQTGFTALIADGHSRKVKYMQALALGLPCIAVRWITSCLNRNRLLDWSPYLLCAGQSSFLGDAIRSRNLAPYDAATARLPDIIGKRPKLLEGTKILLVMKKQRESKKLAYVFLARVLGAALSRVYSAEEARGVMKAVEEAGEPFDWVYVDDKSDTSGLFTTAPAPPVDKKKRKRASTAAVSPPEPPPKRIRTLSDELVIQSLILGRLIEEGEMEQ